MSRLFCAWCYEEIKNGEMFVSYDGMLVHKRCETYLEDGLEFWTRKNKSGAMKKEEESMPMPVPECCGSACGCKSGEKQILNVCFDNDEGRWIIQVSFTWKGNIKDGLSVMDHPESSILYGYAMEYSLLEEPNVWYIGGYFSAEREDIFAEKVVQELLKKGWVWQ